MQLLHDKVFCNRNKKSWFCKESDSCSPVIVMKGTRMSWQHEIFFKMQTLIAEAVLISKCHLKRDSFVDVHARQIAVRIGPIYMTTLSPSYPGRVNFSLCSCKILTTVVTLRQAE